MTGINYCLRHLVWWFLPLMMLGLLVKPSASEQYMAYLCGGTIQAEGSGGVLLSQSGPLYQDNIDCTLIITADQGRQIFLTFSFLDIEGVMPNCRSDYLLIWDGVSDFQSEPDLADICGHFTGNVTSERNAVSLRFVTDSSVTYRGFKLAYTSFKIAELGSCDLGEFLCDNSRCIDSSLQDDNYNNCGDHSDERRTVKTMNQMCGQTINVGKNAGLLLSQAAERYSNNFDCTLTLVADYGRRILLHFEYLSIEGDGNGDGCLSKDVLIVYDGAAAGTVNRTLLCGSRAADIATSGPSATLRFKTDHSVVYQGFAILYTSIRTPTAGSCYQEEFRCTNNRCINANLTFNSFNNCGDNSDEQHFVIGGGGDSNSTIITHSETVITLAAWLIVVIVIACLVALVVVILCCAFVCYLACRRSERPAQQQASYVTAPPQQVGAPLTGYNQQPPMAMQTTGPPANPQPDGQATTYPQLYPVPSEQDPPPNEIKS